MDQPRADTTKHEKYLAKTESDSLTTVVIRIEQADQYDRNQMGEVAAKFRGDSHQMKTLVRHMKQTYSLNFSDMDRILTR
ncbi:hypothetical protein [Spirosoma agri]|uniref:Uncharacterized protein n=1 Tax=Spirosoma agri TaxID=1987381 RepID=A0A6M0IGU3_9BACT|nr:hypothetical protein [Spirosoma agri]NEU67418.1 hypothetical protein [Spirosoma agri]